MAKDLDALQGRWNISALETDGAEVSATAFADAGITIDGDRFVSTGMGLTYEGTVVIDQAKKPKSIDLLFTEGHAAGTRNVGIYELTGDRWTICLATRGSRRPRTFATRADTGLALETLERAADGGRSPRSKTKSAATQKPGAASVAARRQKLDAPSSSKSSGAITPWEGEWKMVSGVFSGVPMAQNMVEWVRRETRGDITKVLAGPQTMVHARFTLDDSRQPNLVEYANLSGSNKGNAQSGIAELAGDTLRVCVAAPGKPRPDEFTSKKGDGRSLTTWRLVKRS